MKSVEDKIYRKLQTLEINVSQSKTYGVGYSEMWGGINIIQSFHWDIEITFTE